MSFPHENANNRVIKTNCLRLLQGFFYITDFGLTQEQVDRQFAIGKEVFQLSTEEKLKYRADLENGGYNGYKPLGLRVSSTRDIPLPQQCICMYSLLNEPGLY